MEALRLHQRPTEHYTIWVQSKLEGNYYSRWRLLSEEEAIAKAESETRKTKKHHQVRRGTKKLYRYSYVCENGIEYILRDKWNEEYEGWQKDTAITIVTPGRHVSQ